VCPTLFVYGTLRSTSRNQHARALHRASKLLGPARVKGRLRRVGHYRGLVFSRLSEDWIDGELYRLSDAAPILASLDEYEGATFRRVLMKAIGPTGRPTRCWAYLYMGR
jgi:gamma-glutamylcyclotransferase (GGCT)/AIG2-like uncharacterized protein YtfP